MGEWRYASLAFGAQSVMMIGMSGILQLCVDNWDIVDVSLCLSYFNHLCYYTTYLASTPLYRHPILSNGSFFYHMDYVSCVGNERNLSECGHNRYGLPNCDINSEQAGVRCNGE